MSGGWLIAAGVVWSSTTPARKARWAFHYLF